MDSVDNLNTHVYKASEVGLHIFQGRSCPCVPKIIRQRPEDGLVFVHKELGQQ